MTTEIGLEGVYGQCDDDRAADPCREQGKLPPPMVLDRWQRRTVAVLGQTHHLDDTAMEALGHVARHEVVPATTWMSRPHGQARKACARTGLNDWILEVYRHHTQAVLDIGARPASTGRTFIRGAVTACVPSWEDAAALLAAARVAVGHRVLHIDGGSGWLPEIFSYIDLERLVALHARRRHATAAERGSARRLAHRQFHGGLRPPTEVRRAVGEAVRGASVYGPYDRIISEHAVVAVPAAWLAQARRGGIIVAPWRAPDGNCLLMQLHIDSGGAATGQFTTPVTGLPFSAAPPRLPDLPDTLVSYTEHDAAAIAEDPDVRTGVLLRLPGCRMWRHGPHIAIIDPASRSWALLTRAGERRHAVRQWGPRRLWAEIVSARQDWRRCGSPGVGDYRITATTERTWVWHRYSGNVVWSSTTSSPPGTSGNRL